MRLILMLVAALLLPTADISKGVAPSAVLAYRGFTVDVSAARDAGDLGDIETSVKHQLDIVADCGAGPTVLAFFRAQRIALGPKTGNEGRFSEKLGVQIDAVPEPTGEPIVLHELLHAFHARMLPGGFRNPQIVDYYSRAKEAKVYPDDAFVLKNPLEFFAVTASLYLYGHVDRPPFTREILRSRQPYYYAWLGRLFGVQK